MPKAAQNQNKSGRDLRGTWGAWFAKRTTTGRFNPQTATRGRATNRENLRSRQLSKSKERRNRTRSTNQGRRIGDERRLSDQFETITFEWITVDAIKPKMLSTNEVSVTVNIESQHQQPPSNTKGRIGHRSSRKHTVLAWNWKTARSVSHHGRSIVTSRSACSTTPSSDSAKSH